MQVPQKKAEPHIQIKQQNTAASSPAEVEQSPACYKPNKVEITPFDVELDLTKSSEGTHDLINNNVKSQKNVDLADATHEPTLIQSTQLMEEQEKMSDVEMHELAGDTETSSFVIPL